MSGDKWEFIIVNYEENNLDIVGSDIWKWYVSFWNGILSWSFMRIIINFWNLLRVWLWWVIFVEMWFKIVNRILVEGNLV